MLNLKEAMKRVVDTCLGWQVRVLAGLPRHFKHIDVIDMTSVQKVNPFAQSAIPQVEIPKADREFELGSTLGDPQSS